MTDRPRALAVLIAVFLVGCIVGAAGSYYWLKKDYAPRNWRRAEGPPPPQGRQRFRPDLQLTQEQDARFREIMTEYYKQLEALRAEQAPKLEALRKEQSPKIDAIRAETNRKLEAILDPEQKKKFDAFLKEMENMRRRPPRGREFRPPQ